MLRITFARRCAKITPWSVSASSSSSDNNNISKGFDYARVVETFKSQPIDVENDIARLKDAISKKSSSSLDDNINNSNSNSNVDELTAPLERYLRRGIVFSQRDLHPFLDTLSKRHATYLYTGRGPSASSMHIGHLLPFFLCRDLQKAMKIPLVVQITDDEKFLFRNLELSQLDTLATENIRDIIACGLDIDRTFIFRNTKFFGDMYLTILQIQRCLSTNAVQHTFGFGGSDSVGKLSFAATQAAPAFATTFSGVLPWSDSPSIMNRTKCLIPCAIDQDPFFLLMRNNCCGPLKKPRPSLLHTSFLPSLKGPSHKMSSSDAESSVILLSDTDEAVRKKMKSAFSGGRATLQELREKGADLEADVAYQYLRYFLEDEEEFKKIGEEYKTGQLTTGQVKERASDVVIDVLKTFREKRAAVSDSVLEEFCRKRLLAK